MRGGWSFSLVWRVVTYALLMVGFLALCLTGEIHPLVTVAFPVLWAIGFFMDRPPAWWRDWITRTVIWIALLGIGFMAMQANFNSVLYLLLFLGLFKCFSMNGSADHTHSLVIAFFMFLACSVITSSVFYLFSMVMFIVLIMLELICLTIAREGDRAMGGRFTREIGRAALQASGGPPFFRRLFASSLMIGLIVLVMAFGIFLVAPHFSAHRLNPPWPTRQVQNASTPLSGYSDEMTLGAIEQLKLDDREVMTVTPAWEDHVDRPFPTGLRLRGLALDQYNERQWERHSVDQEKNSGAWNTVNLPMSSTFNGPVLYQTINQNIRLTRRLFGAVMPFQFQLAKPTEDAGMLRPTNTNWRMPSVGLRVRLDWATQSVQVTPTISERSMGRLYALKYQVASQWIEDSSSLMRSLALENALRSGGKLKMDQSASADPAGQAVAEGQGKAGGARNFVVDPDLIMSAGDRAINTQLPPTKLTARLKAISQTEASAPDIPGKIAQLLAWFNLDFEYSLNPETPKGMHPIDAFLTRTRKGHCEYFATAFVLLLRAQNIPARVATGFYTTEWRQDGDFYGYVVRQSDAHAWAEVWLNGYGWLTFDPTPPDWRGRAARTMFQPTRWTRLTQELRAYWQHYVLDYSTQQQERIMATLRTNRLVQRLISMKDLLVELVKALPVGRNGSDRRPSDGDLLWRGLMLLTAGLLTLLLIMQFATRSAKPGEGPQRSPVFFMNALIERLQALGWARAESQTPAELIQRVERETEGRWRLKWILDIYYRCRFARETPSAEEQSRVNEAIRNLK